MAHQERSHDSGGASGLQEHRASPIWSDYSEFAYQHAPIGMCLIALDGRFLSVNRAMCEMLGYTETELLQRTVVDVAGAADVELTKAQLERVAVRGGPGAVTFEKSYVHRLGHLVWGSVSTYVHRDASGAPGFFITHIVDITERRRAEDARRENEEKFRIAFENAPMGMSIIGPQGQYLAVNPALCRMFGYSKDDLLAGTINRITHPDDIERGNAWIRKMMSGDTSEPEFEKRYLHKDGHIVWGLVRAEWVRNSDNSPKMSVVHVLDITERKHAEQALLTRERELREAHAIAQMGHWQQELSDGSETWADGIHDILETDSTVSTPSHGLFLSRVHPDDREMVDQAHRAALQRNEATDIVHRLLLPGGRVKHVRRISRTESSATGQPLRVVGILQDISIIRRAEEERAHLEDRLHQAQKMEAVGYLAGGIAHDFNNLLTVMGGNASLALLETEPGSPLHEPITEILKGVDSAADLTRQLLAFSRKQVIAPRVVNLNDTVARLSSMLKRLLGEDLEFVTALDPDLAQVQIDVGQAEQILVNLAVNARDAMVNGGRLTINTANVTVDEESTRHHAGCPPGRYVMLAVSDSGVGMPAEIRDHIFEPFFTTKEQGRGTGLGLAMVYGAVHQNHGTIDVCSEPGMGTTFEIYLPAVDADAEDTRPDTGVTSTGGHETVVVVEDDESVRSLCVRVLEHQGYRVLPFSNGFAALEAMRTTPEPVALVITDVVMPGMNGRVLSEETKKLRPAAKILFTSGYTESVIAHHGVLEPGVEFLSKPYSYAALARRVRDLLDT